MQKPPYGGYSSQRNWAKCNENAVQIQSHALPVEQAPIGQTKMEETSFHTTDLWTTQYIRWYCKSVFLQIKNRGEHLRCFLLKRTETLQNKALLLPIHFHLHTFLSNRKILARHFRTRAMGEGVDIPRRFRVALMVSISMLKSLKRTAYCNILGARKNFSLAR